MNDLNESHKESPQSSSQGTPHQAAKDEASKKLRRRRIRDNGLGKNNTHIPETTRRWRERFKT